MTIKETVLLVSITLIVVPVTYGITLHHRLSSRVNHEKSSGGLSSNHKLTKKVASIPDSAFKTPHFMIYDHAWKVIRFPAPPAHASTAQQTSSTGQDKKDITDFTTNTLTTYLRYTLTLFATRLPQAWILHKVVPASAKASFSTEHIQRLDFQEGDLACGVYRVVLRTHDRVEFEMLPMPGPAASMVEGGRLVIALRPRGAASYADGVEDAGSGGGRGGSGVDDGNDRDGDGDWDGEAWVLSTSTVMWKAAGCRARMPLEGGIGKWMHELASWYLLDSGSRYLVDLKGKRP